MNSLSEQPRLYEKTTVKHFLVMTEMFLHYTYVSSCSASIQHAIHTLLANTVEVCGGSRKLLKILNRFGAARPIAQV